MSGSGSDAPTGPGQLGMTLRSARGAFVALVLVCSSAAGLTDEAERFLVAGDYERAASELGRRAAAGDAGAAVRLGAMYRSGIVIEKDLQRSASLLLYAAEHGNARAAFLMGDAYERGLGVPSDRMEAERWYHAAAQAGHEQARARLAPGTKVMHTYVETNQRDGFGRSALMHAARQGDVNAAAELLNHGADVDLIDRAGRTALCYAAEVGRADIVDLLVKAGADVGASDKHGNTPLHLAAAHGNAEAERALLGAGASPARTNLAGLRPEDLASRNQQVASREGSMDTQAVSAFTTEALNVMAQFRGWPALSVAAWHGDLALTRRLYSQSDWPDAILRAISRDQAHAVRLLLELADTRETGVITKGQLLHVAIDHRAYQSLLTLAEAGANLDERDPSGAPPLVEAVRLSWNQGATFLIGAGAQVDAADTLGMTPLMYAARHGDGALIKRLLAASASPLTRNRWGHAAIWYSVTTCEPEIIDLLWRPELHDDEPSDSALHRAAALGSSTCVRNLLAAGHPVSVTDRKLVTPLAAAAAAGSAQAVSLLAQRGAKLDGIDAAGNTALHTAILAERIEAADALVKLGANGQVRNANGISARDLANRHLDTRWQQLFAERRFSLQSLFAR